MEDEIEEKRVPRKKRKTKGRRGRVGEGQGGGWLRRRNGERR